MMSSSSSPSLSDLSHIVDRLSIITDQDSLHKPFDRDQIKTPRTCDSSPSYSSNGQGEEIERSFFSAATDPMSSSSSSSSSVSPFSRQSDEGSIDDPIEEDQHDNEEEEEQEEEEEVDRRKRRSSNILAFANLINNKQRKHRPSPLRIESTSSGSSSSSSTMTVVATSPTSAAGAAGGDRLSPSPPPPPCSPSLRHQIQDHLSYLVTRRSTGLSRPPSSPSSPPPPPCSPSLRHQSQDHLPHSHQIKYILPNKKESSGLSMIYKRPLPIKTSTLGRRPQSPVIKKVLATSTTKSRARSPRALLLSTYLPSPLSPRRPPPPPPAATAPTSTTTTTNTSTSKRKSCLSSPPSSSSPFISSRRSEAREEEGEGEGEGKDLAVAVIAQQGGGIASSSPSSPSAYRLHHQRASPPSSSPPSSSASPSPSHRFRCHVGDYELFETLGSGMSGIVKRAQHVVTGETVALKIMDKAKAAMHIILQLDSEIQALQTLDHPHIIKLYHVDHQALYAMPNGRKVPSVTLALEYVENGELFDHVMHTGHFSETLARTLFKQLLSAMKHCHEKGIYHRDIKPENLLLDQQYKIKVADFGLAVICGSKNELVRTDCGTRSYMAPEAIDHIPHDGSKADTWSMGIVLFILLAGNPPFQKAEAGDWWYDAICQGEYAKFWQVHQKYSPYFPLAAQGFLTAILQSDPSKRPTVEQLVAHEWMQGPCLSSAALFVEMASRKLRINKVKTKKKVREIE